MGALAVVVVLMAFPETALNAAREAALAWYTSVAPALFPFMALMPALTSEQAARTYERLLGRWLRPMLNMPGAAAPALVVGMIAGSPAGAFAAVRICAAAGLTRDCLERIVCCACGLSPAFLITGVGVSMLGSAAEGHILMRAQIFSQLTMLLLTRRSRPSEPLPRLAADNAVEPVRAAVLNVLTVCGYMALFNVAAAVTAQVLRSEIAGLGALCVLDLPSAARAVAGLPINKEAKLLIIAALTGLGGLCIAAQNLAACGRYGVSRKKYAASRLSHAALMTAATAVQLRLSAPAGGNSLPPLEFSALITVFLMAPTLISWKKDPFLNKRKFEIRGKNAPNIGRKPQDVVSESGSELLYVVK